MNKALSAAIVGVIVIAISLGAIYVVIPSFSPPPDDGQNDDPSLPKIMDPDLRVERVIEGLAIPTSMAFIDDSNLLVLEKNTGQVRLVANGTLTETPILSLSPHDQFIEQGLLGIAAVEDAKTVFVYITEKSFFGDVHNNVYRYNWQDGKLINPVKILELPGKPGPNHNGGRMVVGPDNYLYVVIGDLMKDGMLQNYKDGPNPDDSSVILKVDFDGKPAANILSSQDPNINTKLQSYYAYGIRNSFGLAFDPVTGVLWDTENGPEHYDEINLVAPGFNSGWEQVMGPISRTSKTEGDLVQFENSRYADPVFSWKNAHAPTDIEFLKSKNLGEKYENNIFVGTINEGHLYFFTVNKDRNGIEFAGTDPLSDLVADNGTEGYEVLLGTEFQGITDLETGPDGNLYVLSFSGNIYRIVPKTAQ